MKKIKMKILAVTIITLMVLVSVGAASPILKDTEKFVEKDYIPGNVIVGFTDDFSVKELNVGDCDPVLNQEILQKIDFINAIVVKVKVGAEDLFIEKYLDSVFVKYAEKNNILKSTGDPNDPSWSKQWGPKNIKCPDGWGGAGSNSAVIAILDTGVDLTHEDLIDNLWTDGSGNHGRDVYNDDNDPQDENGHGTHCAGIAAAVTNNGKGIAGVAGSKINVKIMAVQVLSSGGSGSSASVAGGIDYAVSKGADVISMSLGGGGSSTMETACKNAHNAGVVVVAAAGNDNSDRKSYPAGYDSYVIAVGATDNNNEKASFSNYGDWVDIAAPGVNIYSTYITKNKYRSLSGTSMACPHVAGVAALGVSRGWSNTRVWEELENSADELSDKDFVEWGKVDATYDGGGSTPDDLEVIVTIDQVTNNCPSCDEIDYGSSHDEWSPEWYYRIIGTSGGKTQTRENFDQGKDKVTSSGDMGISYYDNDWEHRQTWNAEESHKFSVYSLDKIMEFEIKLYDHDPNWWEGDHDMADISERTNWDNGDCTGSPSGRTFYCSYDIVNNKLVDSDKSEPLNSNSEFPRYTGGWFDGSDGPEIPGICDKQDDAKLTFSIADTYEAEYFEPKIDVDGDLDFGTVKKDNELTRKITVKNDAPEDPFGSSDKLDYEIFIPSSYKDDVDFSKMSGSLGPQQSHEITVTVDTSGLSTGDYEIDTEVRSNDKDVEIPITMTLTNSRERSTRFYDMLQNSPLFTRLFQFLLPLIQQLKIN